MSKDELLSRASAILEEEPLKTESQKGGIKARLAGKGLGASILLILFVHFGAMQRLIREGSLAGKSPIQYPEEIIPEKSIYHPGEAAVFWVNRDVSLAKGEVIGADIEGSITQVEDGRNYRVEGRTRNFSRTDEGWKKTVVVIPEITAAGTYCYGGKVTCWTELRTRPALFTSKTFEVVEWKSEQDRAAGKAQINSAQRVVAEE